MRKYPAYKDSGVEWIGKIPESWKINRLKRIATLTYGDSLANEERIDGDIPVYGSNGIVGYHNKAITNKPCIVIGRKGSYGKVNFSHTECFPIDTAYFIDGDSSKCDLRWLNYILPLLELDKFSKDTGVPGLNREDAHDKKIPIPCDSVQKSIADYLDRKIFKIDELIAKKERMIDLLKEERTVIINQAVTKGLNPKVEMQDSGIDWLGTFPTYWNMVRLRFLCNITTGDKDTVNREAEGEYPFFVRSPVIERISTYSFDGEAVLTAGDGAGVGKVFHYYNGKFDFHQRVYMFFCFRKVIGRYFFYFLRTNLHKVVCRGDAKSTVDSVRLPFLQDFPIVFPDVHEQEKIVLFIDKKLDQIDDQIRLENKSIELLKEYRVALIAEIVTGKTDTRN